MAELGFCNGVENYSRYLSGRKAGEAPPCLFDYIPENAIVFVDESHVSVPQIGGNVSWRPFKKRNTCRVWL